MKKISLKIGLVCAALLAGALRWAPIEGSVVIANKDVPVDSISAAALKDIYSGRTAYWQGGQSVVFSGRGQLPRKADDAGPLVALVASTRGAIALVPADAVLSDVKILEVK